ncbi:MAG TPA: hypothetical protein VMR31_10135 [Myxococcota bacterium]|nr:hypothetical protein [Myxococcota bacterium]
MPNAKGTVVVEAVKALLSHGERVSTYLPPKLAKYLEQRIVLASWYPLEDHAELLRTLAKVGSGRENPCEKMGRDAARAHMEGTYSRFNKTADRKAAFTLLSSMYDTGEMRVVERDAGRAVVELVAFAQPTREICDTFTGYQGERMLLLGFEDVVVKHTKCRVVGAVSCIWEIAWKSRDTE